MSRENVEGAASRRLMSAVLAVVLGIGSLAVWTLVPAGWLYLTKDVSPGGVRFVTVLLACPLTMVAVVMLLYRVDGHRQRLSGAPERSASRSGWLRSVSDARRSRSNSSLLEVMLVASALIALILLGVWWGFFADALNPSGPTAPGTEHNL